jgi:DNA modification methylase
MATKKPKDEPAQKIAEPIAHLAVPIDSLNHDPANARKHGQKNLDAIKSSLAMFGQRTPIVVQKAGMIVRAGNGRLDAAKALGWTRIAAVIVDDDNATAAQFAIADNRTAELAEWDHDTLSLLLDGWDKETREAVGFTQKDIDEVLECLEPSGKGEVVEDEVPDPPADPVTKPGDLWLLGEHRLLCGDSTKTEDVNRLMAGAKADMVLSDPPYGVSYVGKTKDELKVENDELDEEDLKALVMAAFDNAEAVCRAGAYWYATVPAGPLHILFADDWKRRGILRQIMVWAKDSMVLGHSEYHYQHEPILFGWIPGQRHKNSDRTRTTLWLCDRPKASREHPTMKPIELWARAIQDGSRTGETVYDPFLGSGTTLIAAEQLGRKCYGVEISPKYCDVIVKRWETLAGKKAVRDHG